MPFFLDSGGLQSCTRGLSKIQHDVHDSGSTSPPCWKRPCASSPPRLLHSCGLCLWAETRSQAIMFLKGYVSLLEAWLPFPFRHFVSHIISSLFSSNPPTRTADQIPENTISCLLLTFTSDHRLRMYVGRNAQRTQLPRPVLLPA
jgi:hypothetical protein